MTDAERALAQAIAKYDRDVVSLEMVTQKAVKLLNRLVDGLTNEAFGDTETALRNRTVPDGLMKKLKELQSCLASATSSEVTLRKTIKLRSQELTPEQRKAGMQKVILDMAWAERREYLLDCCKKHNDRRTFELEAGIDMATKRDAVFMELL